MTLDQFVQPPPIESEKTDHESSLAELFGRSALYELHQSAFGLAQTVGLQNRVGEMAAPKEADSFWGGQAQMLGRGAGNFLPTMVVAIAARGAVGSALEHAGAAADNLLLKRTAIGLSLTESAVTGLVSGALLKPSDEQVARDWSSFIADRTGGGVAGGLSFSAMTLGTFGWNKIAASKTVAAVGLDGLFKSAAVTGVVSGLPGGLANVEFSSLLSDGKFTADSGKIGQSIYEMSVFGGLFGASSNLLARMGGPRYAAQRAEPNTLLAADQESSRVPSMAITEFIKEEGNSGKELVRKLGDSQDFGLGRDRLVGLARLNEIYGESSQTAQALRQLSSAAGSVPINLADVAKFIQEQPVDRKAFIEQLVAGGAGADEFGLGRLIGLESLKKSYSDNPEVVQEILRAEDKKDLAFLWSLSKFVESSPESGKELVAELAAKRDAHLLNAGGLLARLELNDIYGKNSEIVKQFAGEYEKDRTKFSFQGIADFIKGAPESRQQLVERLAQEAGDTKYLGRYWLYAAEEIEKVFGQNSPEARLVLKAKTPEAALSIVDAHFSNPAATKSLLQRFAEAGVTALPLHKENIVSYLGLNSQLNGDPALLTRVLAAAPANFEPRALLDFISQSPNNHREFVSAMMDLGLSPARFSELAALQLVSSHLGEEPELIKRAIAFDEQGVKISWLAEPLKMSPFPWVLAVRALLQEPALTRDVGDLTEFHKYLSTFNTPKYFSEGDDFITRVRASSLDWQFSHALVAAAQFMEEEPATRPEIVRRLLAAKTPAPNVSREWLSGVERLYKQFGGERDTLERILWTGALKPGAVADFVEAEGESGKDLVRKVALGARSVVSDPLDVSRLKSLILLNRTFGEDSPAMQRLRRLESENESLNEVARFIDGDPQRKALVESLINTQAGASSFRLQQLEGRLQLNASFGADSVTMRRLSTSNNADMIDLWRFIKGSYDEQSLESTARAQARIALAEKSINAGANPLELVGARLQGLFDLNERLGEESDAMKRILAQERSGDVELSWLAYLAKSELGRGYLEQFAHDKEMRLDTDQISALAELNAVLQPDQTMAARIVALAHDGLDAAKLDAFIHGYPGNEQRVAELIRDGASVGQLSTERLVVLDWLGKLLSGNTGVYIDLVKLEPAGLNLQSIANFLSLGPAESRQERINLISDVLAEGSGVKQLAVSRLVALEWARAWIGIDSPLLKQILARESEGLSLSELQQFANKLGDVQSAKNYIQRMIEENQPIERFEHYDMLSRATMGNVFGEDSPIFGRMLELCQEGLNPIEFAEFVGWHKSRLPAIERMVKDGATLKDLQQPRFENLARIYDALGSEPLMIKRLREMEGEGVNLLDIGQFLIETPEDVLGGGEGLGDKAGNASKLLELLKNGHAPREFSLDNLRDIEALMYVAKHLKPATMDYLEALQKNGLSGMRMAQYIAERPEQRSSDFEQLVEEKADANRFKDQMRLIAFPENVASALVQRAKVDGLSVPEIIGHLRDWQSGRYFRELVIDQVQSGKPIAAADLKALASQARELGSSVSQEVPAFATGYRKASDKLSKLADTLNQAAERIESVVPKDKPLVLLGRDTWPLLPVIRAKGYDASYFLWSRENERDSATYDQWMKEVRPGAVVIDTGWGGRIINWIRERDKTVSGLLLSKNPGSGYDQILDSSDHRARAEMLEDLVKYINRSKSYTESGGVKLAKDSPDGTVARKYTQFDGVNRFAAEAEIRDLLRATGLPEWDVWRYSTYVGLTPQERLGISSRAQVEEHYRNVEQLRDKHSTASKTAP